MFTFRDFAMGIGAGVDTKKTDKVVLSMLIKESSPNDRGIIFSFFFIPGYIKFLPFPSYAKNLFNINLSVIAKHLYTKAQLYAVANSMTYSGFNQGFILYLNYIIIKPELGFNLYQTKSYFFMPGSYRYSYSANIECVIVRWKNVRFTLKPGIEFSRHQEPLFDLRIGFEYRQR